MTLEQLIDKGRVAESKDIVGPELDGVMLLYKGQSGQKVELTHKHLFLTAQSVQNRLDSHKLTKTDSILITNQMHSRFSQVLLTIAHLHQCKIGLQSALTEPADPVKSLLDDLVEIKPTVLDASSQMLVMFYQQIQAQLKASKGCTYWFIEKCVQAKL